MLIWDNCLWFNLCASHINLQLDGLLYVQVAHYLILTHLSEQTSTMPMLDITNMRKRDRPEVLAMDNPVFKQARLAYDVSQDARHRSGYGVHQQGLCLSFLLWHVLCAMRCDMAANTAYT